MNPVGSFERMKIELTSRERARGTDIPITVGILIADCRDEFQRSQIFNNLPDFNILSGKRIDFYIPGYCSSTMRDMDIQKYGNESCYYSYNERFTLGGKTYFFSESDYFAFIKKLRARGIKYKYQPMLILLPYVKSNLRFSDAIIFDLQKEYNDGVIENFGMFFNEIFEIASYTTECDEFGMAIFRERRRNFFRFIIGKLLDATWDIIENYLPTQ